MKKGDCRVLSTATAMRLCLIGKYEEAAPNGGTEQDITIDITDPTKFVVYVDYASG